MRRLMTTLGLAVGAAALASQPARAWTIEDAHTVVSGDETLGSAISWSFSGAGQRFEQAFRARPGGGGFQMGTGIAPVSSDTDGDADNDTAFLDLGDGWSTLRHSVQGGATSIWITPVGFVQGSERLSFFSYGHYDLGASSDDGSGTWVDPSFFVQSESVPFFVQGSGSQYVGMARFTIRGALVPEPGTGLLLGGGLLGLGAIRRRRARTA